MPTDKDNDDSIPKNLAWLLKIYEDAYIKIHKIPGKDMSIPNS